MTFMELANELDQEERIKKLRAELEKIGGTVIDDLKSMPSDMEEQFLRHVLEYESQEPISLLTRLAKLGVEVPPPDQLDDKKLQTKLNEVIHGMATLGAYLLHTNHLSDRELYEFLPIV